MIIDQFGVFFDKENVSSAMTSKTVNLMPYAGRDSQVCISLVVAGTNPVECTLEVQQSEDNTTFTTIETLPLHKTGTSPVMAAIRLPLQTKSPYCRLVAKITGETAGNTLFAGVTRDHFAPYEKGLYIDGGKKAK